MGQKRVATRERVYAQKKGGLLQAVKDTVVP